VRDGLWLYQYGFDRRECEFVDGAYFRGVILSELAVAGRIFCVRPINHCWQGDLPRNYPELEDLKTEIGFDGSYCGERYQIELVNKLLDTLNAAEVGKYHPIDLQEIEIRQPRGYFDYLFESEQVFAEAYEDAMRCFDKLGYRRRAYRESSAGEHRRAAVMRDARHVERAPAGAADIGGREHGLLFPDDRLRVPRLEDDVAVV